MQFYMLVNGQRKGPLTPEQLAIEGLERDSLVWHTGLAGWVRADQVSALEELMLTIPPPVPSPPDALGPARPPTALPAPAPALPPPWSEDALFAAAWVRYQPKTFKTLYAWYALSLALCLALALTATVLFILAANESYNRRERIFDVQMGVWHERWVPDPAAQGRRDTKTALAIISVILAWCALIASITLLCVQLYKAWNQIQDGYARTSASKAVGFLFLPFFNLYWLFVAVYGLACDLHNYVVRRRLYGRYDLTPYPVSPGLSLACFILMVSNWIPFVNFVTFIPAHIVLVIWLHGVKTASAGIAAARLAEPAWGPEPMQVPPPAAVPVPIPEERSEHMIGPLLGPIPEERSAHVRRRDGETSPRLEDRG
jgi:hypothetical protein